MKTWNNFIFSNQLEHRLVRHLALWIVFSAYFFIVNFVPTSAADFTNTNAYDIAFSKLIYIPVSILSAYITAYILLPRFLLKGKYLTLAFSFVVLCGFNLFSAYLITKLYALLTEKTAFNQLSMPIRFFQPVIYGLGLGTASSVFAGVGRLLKIHYTQQKENERLERLKITTELEIVTNHFHPHFLSDALQNISRLIRSHSELSPTAILRLADLLSYFLYENNKERVPLEQELQMVDAYIELQKLFYDNRTVIHINKPEEPNSIQIAPLILVSIVQYCCEQSLLSLHEKLLVEIDLETQDNQLNFSFHCNGYYEGIHGAFPQNAGLESIIKRVELLYPGTHSIETQLNNSTFTLKLLLHSEKMPLKSIDESKTSLTYEPA